MVAPVPPIRLDQVGREDLAGVEGDDRDLPLVDDGEDAPAGMGGTDVEVIQAAGPPHAQNAAREPDSDCLTLDQEIEGSNPSSPANVLSRDI